LRASHDATLFRRCYSFVDAMPPMRDMLRVTLRGALQARVTRYVIAFTIARKIYQPHVITTTLTALLTQADTIKLYRQ